MNHHEIEIELSRGRAELLEAYAALSAGQLVRPATVSEHDGGSRWTAQDHLAHLAAFEQTLSEIARRKLSGHANPLGPLIGDDGVRRSREEVVSNLTRISEEFVLEKRGHSFDDIVASGQVIRAETLALLGSTKEEQLADKVAGAPFGDGTIGGILASSADHGRMHWKWLEEARTN